MFKQIAIVCLLSVGLVGCSSNHMSNAEKLQQSRESASSAVESSRNKKKDAVSIASKTVYYHQLNTAERKEVTFAFQASSDTTAADSGQAQNAPSPYTVDMQVTNKSDKTVKLDESKIVWLMPNSDVDPVTSDKTRVLTIKPNTSKNVVGLFSDFNNQNFVDTGAFCYLNLDYKLAYSYRAYKDGGVTSKNLTDKKLIAMNTPDDDNSSDTDSAADSSIESTPGEDTSASIKVTPGSQYENFAFTNISDRTITINTDAILLMVDSEFVDMPSDILADGEVVLKPGQTHVYGNFFLVMPVRLVVACPSL
ncbi:hypothetical protein [Lacticaseibacillus thailandensis]|uniref:hypothetical protein n=1 Tax=Lacticaseibacillus thailandensis TaxID=381741 RepID=UPI0006D08633|nr:hypothetical protein [Lacticaseibacillus thailandensis]